MYGSGTTVGKEVVAPPYSLDVNDPHAPPTYVFTLRERPKPLANLHYSGYPASNQSAGRWLQNNYEAIGRPGWQDAPDPVRQSNFVAEGRKIHPFGGDITPLHTALWKSLIMRDAFGAGKLVQFWRPQMYSGTQLPSARRINIGPGQATTFGSQYTVSGEPFTAQVVLSSGISFNYGPGIDGDPYA